MDLDRDKLLWIYRRMRQIREFENRLHQDFAAGLIPGFVHLYAGEEAIAVGVCAHLDDDDFITSTHRGHGHCIAKGVEINGMMAEIRGKAAGCCKGKGGSMHIADFSKGMLGANGIVAGGTPIAVGAALSAQLRRSGQVAACFFGDGATNEGIFHESINLASIWDLPCIFVCENNGYAQSTATCYAMNVEHLAERAKAYNIPGVIVDGQDVIAVYRAAVTAIERARSGKGPTLLECKVLRFHGHYEGDADKYRTKQAVADLRQRDPLKLFAENVAPAAGITVEQLTGIDQRATDELEKAKQFARSSPAPTPEDCLNDVYVDY